MTDLTTASPLAPLQTQASLPECLRQDLRCHATEVANDLRGCIALATSGVTLNTAKRRGRL